MSEQITTCPKCQSPREINCATEVSYKCGTWLVGPDDDLSPVQSGECKVRVQLTAALADKERAEGELADMTAHRDETWRTAKDAADVLIQERDAALADAKAKGEMIEKMTNAAAAFRDDVLNQRGHLEEPCLDNDQTNAVMSQFDDTIGNEIDGKIDFLVPVSQKEIVMNEERMLKWFEFEHLPEHLKEVSIRFWEVACSLCATVEPGPERTVALRKLLEAKDAAVRAKLNPGG